jgi:1-acyl-sn-glycerol-3-phosphate acyltransferase
MTGTKVRAAAFLLFFYLLTTACGLAGLWVRAFARQRALGLGQAWAGMVLAGLRTICGIRIVLSGWQHVPPQGPALIASQHQSAFDTLVWMVLLQRPSYVMKQELTQLPLFGPLLIPAGMIPVDRQAGAAALRGLLADAARAQAAGRQIVIFPEGTRTPPGCTAPLHPGVSAIAARLQLPVLPVATDSGACWPRALLGKRPGDIHIAIGAPLDPGTPRAEMLAKIEAHWRQMERDRFATVDKSVEDASADLQPALARSR